MANLPNHEKDELASRLITAADAIVNHAAEGLEKDLRKAAILLRTSDGPAMFGLNSLTSELTKIANTTSDMETRNRLRQLLGEA
jgi:hypothetical protein